MKLKPNPRFETFLTDLKCLKRPFRKWQGIAFRATPLSFASAVKLLDAQVASRRVAAGLRRGRFQQ